MTSPVTDARTVTTTHTLCIAAPPWAVYRLIADATRWPYLLTPFVHVERLTDGGPQEQLRLWAVGNGAVRDWTTRRTLDRQGLRIRFQQEAPAPPVASMAGEWVFVPLPGQCTSVVLLHEFRAIGDDPVNTALIRQAVDRNSTAELAALRRIAELGEQLPALVHCFADSVTIRAGLERVYEFLYRAREWPRRLPHVSRLILDEAVPGVQTVEMDTGVPGEPVSTTRLVRVCFPHHSIRYKQTQPPQALSAHVGEWRLHPTAEGIRVTAHNTVLLRPGEAGAEFGQRGPVEQGAESIRQALRRNCLAVLLHAKDATEGHSRAAG
jgi:ribosome-associated toxin RatA of RatAB toxin-antitoxin module